MLVATVGNPENMDIERAAVAASVTTILFDTLVDIGPPAEAGLEDIMKNGRHDVLKQWAEDALDTIRASKP